MATVTATIPEFKATVTIKYQPNWNERYPWYLFINDEEVNSYFTEKDAIEDSDNWFEYHYLRHMRKHCPAFF